MLQLAEHKSKRSHSSSNNTAGFVAPGQFQLNKVEPHYTNNTFYTVELVGTHEHRVLIPNSGASALRRQNAILRKSCIHTRASEDYAKSPGAMRNPAIACTAPSHTAHVQDSTDVENTSEDVNAEHLRWWMMEQQQRDEVESMKLENDTWEDFKSESTRKWVWEIKIEDERRDNTTKAERMRKWISEQVKLNAIDERGSKR